MSILVTYGSTRGGTKELAELVADALRSEGFAAEVRPPREVKDLDGYEAVIVGGALYMARWHKEARRFVRSHGEELRSRPTYLFSSGPLDDSATSGDIPPVKGVQALIDLIGAAGHATFGGRLLPDAKGFPASVMAKKYAGDWRDKEQVRRWARSVAVDIRKRLSLPAPAPS